MGPFDRWPSPGQRVRALLRLHRRRDQPVRPGALPGHGPGRAGPDPRGGLPLHRGHDRPRHRLGPPAEGADARQAVLRLLRARARRTRRTTCRPSGPTKYKGKFDDGWDAQRERTFARQKELGVIPTDAELTARPDEIPAWDDDPGRPQAGARPPDGGLRGVHGAHRPPRRPPHRRPRGPRTSSTTRWSTASSATTAPRPRGRRTARSTSCSS